MKAVILAGGLGTRLSEETSIKPKPMVDVGDMPILWHIMKIYAHYGVDDFVILCGYRGHVIKEFFRNYSMRRTNVRFDLRCGSMDILGEVPEPWTVTLVDTGEETMTGGRIRRAREFIGDDTFFLTYGDGVSDVDLSALLGKKPPWVGLHQTASSRPIDTPDSGTPWTPCVTSTTWMSCGAKAKRPGSSGSDLYPDRHRRCAHRRYRTTRR